MSRTILRWVWIAAGFLCLGLASLGVVLPLLPTTPLVIVAAFCFSRGSEKWNQWLHQNRLFGPMLNDWETYGVIKTKAKIMATVAIVLVFGLSFTLTGTSYLLSGALLLIACSILAFIWSRPSSKAESEPAR